MAREALRWSIKELAREANVATGTITRIEAGLPSQAVTRQAIRRALEQAGIVFVRRRDGTGVLLTHANECLYDLLELAKGSRGGAGLDVAVRDRIDRFVTASAVWQREWRLGGRATYVRELTGRIRAQRRRPEPTNTEVLRLALRYIESL